MSERFDDAHLDAGVRASQSSDWSFVATRVVMLAVTFFYLGRAVVQGASPGSLLFPLVAEFASMMWLGLLLGYLVIGAVIGAALLPPSAGRVAALPPEVGSAPVQSSSAPALAGRTSWAAAAAKASASCAAIRESTSCVILFTVAFQWGVPCR